MAWPVTTESLAPNDVVLRGRGLKLSRDSDRDSRHHRQQYSTVGGILPVQLLSQTKPMREEGPGDTADV